MVVNDDINVLALIKGKERYIFLYDDRNAPKRCGCSVVMRRILS